MTNDLYKLNINVHGGTNDVTALDTTMPDAPFDMVTLVGNFFIERLLRDMEDDITTIAHTINTYDQSVTVSVTLNSLMMEHGEDHRQRVGAEVSFILLSTIHDILTSIED